MKIAVGTDKGLLIYQKVDASWLLHDIHFLGMPIGAFHEDASQNWWVAINHKHWGAKIYRSVDQGETFKEVNPPKFNTNSPYSLKSIWTIQSRVISGLLQLLIGTEPAALFNSNDLGQSWTEMDGLSQHPSRNTWQGGGKGSNSPFLHTLLLDQEDADHLLVGISCAGVFQTFDGGYSWKPTNEGLKAFFLPNSESEVGHDPHTIRQSRKNPNVLWQQNHCGIYRSEDYGNTWKDITDKENEAVYGFAMVIAEDNDMRIPANQKLAVYHTHNAGQDWTPQTNGLPSPAFDLVFRHAMDLSMDYITFGTNNGNLYISENKGKQWLTLSQNLSAVRNIKFINP
jgi:photosystem II stability/assembly factor-like uncharacterized protein